MRKKKKKKMKKIKEKNIYFEKEKLYEVVKKQGLKGQIKEEKIQIKNICIFLKMSFIKMVKNEKEKNEKNKGKNKFV